MVISLDITSDSKSKVILILFSFLYVYFKIMFSLVDLEPIWNYYRKTVKCYFRKRVDTLQFSKQDIINSVSVRADFFT